MSILLLVLYDTSFVEVFILTEFNQSSGFFVFTQFQC